MATAIVRVFTGDAFIIAADGRENELDGSVTTDTKQKIFSFGGNRFLAYAFTGHVGLGPEDGTEVVFDFIDEIGKAAQITSSGRYPTLEKYAKRLGQRVQAELENICSKVPIKFYDAPSPNPGEAGSTIADVLIDGYYSGLPSRVNLRFYRLNGQFVEPDITSPGVVVGGVWQYGSRIVAGLMSARDQRFYNEHALRSPETPLPFSDEMYSGVVHARAYIEACSSDEGRRLDPKACSTIGGHIHIASVTQQNGFQWVPGFEPAAKD